MEGREGFKQESMFLEGFVFDQTYRLVSRDGMDGDSDTSGSVSFKIVKSNGSEVKYLTLYNYHNGYYGHGFTFKLPWKKEMEEGAI